MRSIQFNMPKVFVLLIISFFTLIWPYVSWLHVCDFEVFLTEYEQWRHLYWEAGPQTFIKLAQGVHLWSSLFMIPRKLLHGNIWEIWNMTCQESVLVGWQQMEWDWNLDHKPKKDLYLHYSAIFWRIVSILERHCSNLVAQPASQDQ